MVLVLVVWTVGPMLETRLFPVYSKFKIVNIEPNPKGLMVTVQFTKYRNCDPQGYAWYVGDFGKGFEQLNIKARSTTTVRPLGTQITQPFLIEGLEVKDLPMLSAEITNRCHPLWPTLSIIYP
jgi:hypothetical protein